MRDDIQRYWRELGSVTRTVPVSLITQAAEVLWECYCRGGTVFPLGNGGSASTASHFACDLAKGTRMLGQPAFRVMSLADNIPLMTAWANDTSYERVFAEQLVSLVRPGDVLLAISVSGNSPNVLAAADAARAAGAYVIALTGEAGGTLPALANLAIRVPSTSMEQVEDAHLMIAHSLCVALRSRLRTATLEARLEPLALEVAR